jgi:aryl-alcohol dehydrogenase-like predicted oxidoreductase
MKQRTLGKYGPTVSAIGLGCMAMSEFYGKSDDAQSKRVLLTALEKGVTMFDTADTYGFGHNEELIGSVLREWKGEVCVASKCGIVREKGEYKRSINNSPEYIRYAVEQSLRRLKRDVIDLYYMHRRDSSIPIEDTMGALSQLVDEGKIRYIGLSEVSVSTIERAHAVHPLTAIQSEYSLFTRHVEKKILPCLARLGIGFVPYSPLGRGLLSGKLTQAHLEEEGDFRKFLPRTSDTHFDHNRNLVTELEACAREMAIMPAQLALAWVLSKGDTIVPIPGTRREKYLLENIDAVDITIPEDIGTQLETIFHPGAVQGERYTEEGMLGIES